MKKAHEEPFFGADCIRELFEARNREADTIEPERDRQITVGALLVWEGVTQSKVKPING